MIAVATPEWDPLVTPKEPRSFDWAATVSVVKGENKFDVDLKGRQSPPTPRTSELAPC
jgi:hypothetical protein